MPIALMRFLDRWIGVPLCWLLSGHRNTARRQGRIRSILIIKLSEAGSLILAHPLVEDLKREFPGVAIHLLTFEENRQVLRALGAVADASVMTIRHGNVWFFIFDLARALLRMRRLRFDAVIDLEFFSRISAILSFASAARIRAGFSAGRGKNIYRGNLSTDQLAYDPHKHISEQFLAFAGLLKGEELTRDRIRLSLALPVLPLEAAGIETIEKRLINAGWRIWEPVVLMHPGDGNLPLRDWPPEYFVECIRLCLARSECFVVMVGGRAAGRKADKIAASVSDSRCVSFAGSTSLSELLALCTVANCLLAPDSGLAHIASLTGINRVVLFGPESPERFAPLSGGPTRILSSRRSCSPCFSAYNHRTSCCRNNLCLQDIKPAEACEHIIGSIRAAGMAKGAVIETRRPSFI